MGARIGEMFATIQKAQALLQIGTFDHAAGAVRLCSLELGAPFGAAETANEGSWQITPFTGEGVNNNAPMRVGTDPENYQTTGGYALYPGPCHPAHRTEARHHAHK